MSQLGFGQVKLCLQEGRRTSRVGQTAGMVKVKVRHEDGTHVVQNYTCCPEIAGKPSCSRAHGVAGSSIYQHCPIRPLHHEAINYAGKRRPKPCRATDGLLLLRRRAYANLWRHDEGAVKQRRYQNVTQAAAIDAWNLFGCDVQKVSTPIHGRKPHQRQSECRVCAEASWWSAPDLRTQAEGCSKALDVEKPITETRPVSLYDRPAPPHPGTIHLVYRKSFRRPTALDCSKKSNRVPVILIMNNVSVAHADHRDVALVVSLFRNQALPTPGELKHNHVRITDLNLGDVGDSVDPK